MSTEDSQTTFGDDVEYILDQLSADELEVAAKADYDYARLADGTKARSYARSMAARYLRSAKERELAVERMRATIKFRAESDVDGLRQAFTDPSSDYGIPLKKFLSKKMLFVQGYDNGGHATIHFVARRVHEHDPEWTIKAHMWTMEKAIACTKSKDKTVNVMVDFDDFSLLRNSPPLQLAKNLMTTLRKHYVGHVNVIFMLNAPGPIVCLWNLLKPFAGSKTRDKVYFLSSDEEKKTFEKIYSQDQAAPWMISSGKKDRHLDIDEYLFDTPFHKAFDD